MSLSNKLSITDVDVKGKRVLIRVSSDCPAIAWRGFAVMKRRDEVGSF
jgi:hypothetical protein